MLAIALIIGTAAATSPQASKLHASRMVPAQPALPKVLELRGGGMVPGDLVVKATQAVFGGYGLALLARPDLVSRLLFLRLALHGSSAWCVDILGMTDRATSLILYR